MRPNTGRVFSILCVLSFLPLSLPGQQRRTDSLRVDSTQHADSTHRKAARLEAVTIVAAPAERAQPVSATHVSELTVRQTPASNAWDLLRQTAGVEVHEQNQGPGFASDAAVRGFSSDHSTDLALWVDGVPINEPINGHAEGYNDWTVVFPGGIQDIDVIKGPTSALFGNFALAGVVNVRTLERMRGTELTATAGSFGRADAMVMSGFDHGARGGGIFGAHYQHENGFRPNSAYDLGHAHARVVHDLSPS
ncbi:MAG TPA: Plug domain-containing protein, partial [Gemmatimonadaceae bacterium]|nr:Plug domain-containing protein [Gemmatimonadaceae bacterium]